MNQVAEIAQHVGVLMITAVATIGMLELPGYHATEQRHALAAMQPAFVHAAANAERSDNAQRSAREETGPHYISYGVAQRTPARTGWL